MKTLRHEAKGDSFAEDPDRYKQIREYFEPMEEYRRRAVHVHSRNGVLAICPKSKTLPLVTEKRFSPVT